MIPFERNRNYHRMNLRHGSRLNSSFNQEYDQYYGRNDWSNTNQEFSMDHDNNYEPNAGFTSSTNPNSGSNYNQQLFNDKSELALRPQRMSSHLLGWDRPGLRSSNQGMKGLHYGKGPKGYHRSDEKIKEDVSDALYAHDGIDASEIEISVHQGIVKLSGSVLSRQLKRMVEDVIDYLPGVEDVQNELIISKE